MKLLITGSDNYIAMNFAQRYSRRHKITEIDSQTDITDIKNLIPIFKKKKFDAILHFAEVFGRPDQVDKEIEILNTIMFKNIQSLAKAYNVKKIITFSNIRELNNIDGLRAFKESAHADFMPLDSYGMAKFNITNMARIDGSVYVLRSFEVFGKDAPDSVITSLIAQAVEGKSLSVEKDIILSAIYIDDFVKIINNFLMQDFPPGDYNITSDELANINDVLKRLKRMTQNAISISLGKERLEFTASNDKLNSVMGGFKFTTLRSALNRTFKAYKDDV
ncbi:MAG: NAD(P)-dependent oxidoreductase [Clostridiales bacterium]|jgi:nucleoside-diphosphate-sugar epimerase|nr:NAD(P)-dependent oxidoreductase [Clostridiales bacterium]